MFQRGLPQPPGGESLGQGQEQKNLGNLAEFRTGNDEVCRPSHAAGYCGFSENSASEIYMFSPWGSLRTYCRRPRQAQGSCWQGCSAGSVVGRVLQVAGKIAGKGTKTRRAPGGAAPLSTRSVMSRTKTAQRVQHSERPATRNSIRSSVQFRPFL